jgi:hypothetical protein
MSVPGVGEAVLHKALLHDRNKSVGHIDSGFFRRNPGDVGELIRVSHMCVSGDYPASDVDRAPPGIGVDSFAKV